LESEALGEGERLLLVDDDALLLMIGRETLLALGYEVDAVTQPEAALALVLASPSLYVLVLTDQMMPGMTGLVLADKLRQIRADLPIILMTGYDGGMSPAGLEEAGVRGLLLKPWTPKAIGTAINAALAPQPGS
jgi:CheY-like chemotaxis protein